MGYNLFSEGWIGPNGGPNRVPKMSFEVWCWILSGTARLQGPVPLISLGTKLHPEKLKTNPCTCMLRYPHQSPSCRPRWWVIRSRTSGVGLSVNSISPFCCMLLFLVERDAALGTEALMSHQSVNSSLWDVLCCRAALILQRGPPLGHKSHPQQTD